MNNRSLFVILTIACVLPACEGFTCSQERIKSIELTNRGAEEFKNNLYDSAEKVVEQAVQRKPDNANYQYDLGEAYLEAKRIDDAEKALKASTAADPKLFKAWW